MSVKSDSRHNQIRMRSLKKNYQHLSANDEKIAKLAETIEYTPIEINHCWRLAYNQGFYPQKNPNFTMVEIIAQLMTKNDQDQTKLAKLELN